MTRAAPKQPVHPLQEAHNQLGRAEQLRQARKLGQAQRLCESVLKTYPDYVAVLHTLGLVLADRREYAQALPHLVQAAMLNPKAWKTHTALAGVYLRLGAREAAARTLEQARKLQPEDANILATLGEIYRDDREYEAAADAYREALVLDPSLYDVQSGLGSCCMHLGRLEEAAQAYLELLPHHSEAINLLNAVSQLPPSLVDADMLSLLEHAVPAPDQDEPEFESTRAFTAAFAFHNAGRHEEAWNSLLAANRPLDGQHQEDFVSDTKANRDILKGTRNHPVVTKKPKTRSDMPISLFVLGPSRSGKTTTEYLVSALDQVKRGYENLILENGVRYAFQTAGLPTRERLIELPPALDEMFRDHYLNELKERAGTARIFTNTHPGHIISVLRAASILPNVGFVFVKRDLDDIALRIFMKRYRGGNSYAYNVENIREYVAWYYEMIDVLSEKLPHISMVVQYEDMIADPAATLKGMAELCGLDASDVAVPELGDDRGCGQPYGELIAAECGGAN